MTAVAEKLRRFDFQKYGSLFAFVVLFVLSSILSPYFTKPENLLNILRQVSYTGIIALGMTLVIIGGGIDLSVGSMAAFVGAISVVVINWLLPIVPSTPLAVAGGALTAILLGSAAGVANGFLITRGRIAPFIVTLGTLAIYRSLTLYIGQAGEFAGIYTVVLDRGVTKPVYDVWLRNDDQAYARNGMTWVCDQLHGKGNVVLIEGIPSPINDIRVNTAKDVAKTFPGIKILDSQPGNWNRQKALEVMQNYLQKYPHIDAVYTADDDMLQGAMQAYAESKRKDIKVWMGGGGMKEMVKRIMDGDPMIKADATYPPDVVATGVSLAVLGVRGRTFEGFYQKKLPNLIILNSEMITKANAAEYYHPDAPF